MMDDDYIDFLVEAKRRQYSSDKPYTVDKETNKLLFTYTKGSMRYTDSYIGSLFMIGSERVCDNNIPQWGAVYSGGIIDDNQNSGEVYAFLWDVLKRISPENPIRGKSFFSNSKYTYNNAMDGDFSYFMGYESIEYDGQPIYELHYSGGYIE